MPSPEDMAAMSDNQDGLQTRSSERERMVAELERERFENQRLRQELVRSRTEMEVERARLEALASHLGEALILVDVQGQVLLSNDKVLEFTGLTGEQMVRDYGRLYQASADGQGEVPLTALPLNQALHGLEVVNAELTFHSEDRDVTILANAGPISLEGKRLGAVVLFQDISRRTQADRRTQLLNDVSEILATGVLETPQLEHIAALVGDVMGAWSVLALTQPHEDELEVVASWHPDPSRATLLAETAKRYPIVKGIDPGMGRVVSTGKPLLFNRIPPLDQVPDLDPGVRELFTRMGAESMLIVPLMARGLTLGVLMLVSLPHRPRFTEDDLEYCWQLVDRIAATLDNVHLLTDLHHREWRGRMLAEVSRQFAVSLDLQQVLRTVAAQVAEALGDWCTIGLLDDRGEYIHPAAVYHRDPTRQSVIQRLAETYPVEVGDGLTGRVVASQQPVMLTDLTEEDLRNAARNQESLDLLLILRPSAYICVPLTIRGKPIGYLDVACAPGSGRTLSESELELVQELADRASSAIQNAQLYEELQAVIRAKDDWLSVASHELKTPLTPLQVMLQLMQRRLAKGDQVTPEQVDRCLAQVAKLIRLINDLLDVSKLELGQLELTPEVIELRPLVQEVVNSFQDMSDRHEVVLKPGGEGLTIAADRARIEQVLVNLIHNGIKYSPEGGTVTVELRPEEEQKQRRAVIVVEDQGIGIPEHEQPRLFQRYFRGSNVPERNYGGLGLGLWISSEIVRRHNGLLWAESQPGVGSRFYVSLPLATEPVLPTGEQKPVVLIVDDDEAILEAAAECLLEEGYQVHQARNGQAAMAVLARHRPDVVLMDLMMPLMDGWEFTRRIKALPDSWNIKLIVMSATHDLATRTQELGAFDYLSKPFHLEELLQKVKRAIERKEGDAPPEAPA